MPCGSSAAISLNFAAMVGADLHTYSTDLTSAAEVEDAVFETELIADGAGLFRVPAGEYRRQALLFRPFGDEPAAVAVGTVDHPGLYGHGKAIR